MPFNIDEIRQGLQLDGARPSKFMVEFLNPFAGASALAIPLSVKAASIPASIMGQIEVPYFGRTIKIAGDRVYDNWTVNIMNDEDFVIRNDLEIWHSAINSATDNLRREPGLGYKSNAIVTQFAKTGEIIRRYRFDGLFPLVIGEIGLGWDQVNRIEEFPVQFAVDKWVPLNGPTGDGGGE